MNKIKIHQNNQEKSIGYFDLVLPSELSALDIVTDEVFDVSTEEMSFSMLNGDNLSIEGSLRVTLDLRIGRIINIEVSESFLEAGLLNSESLILALNDPSGGFDLEGDIIQPATALGACIRSCQSAYTNNVANCAGQEGSESCVKEAKRMKNVCIGGCI